MAEGEEDSFTTKININRKDIGAISNQQQDCVFAQLTDMFGDCVPSEIINNVCVSCNWQVNTCVEQLIKHIEDNGTTPITTTSTLLDVFENTTASSSKQYSTSFDNNTNEHFAISHPLISTNTTDNMQYFEDQPDVVIESEDIEIVPTITAEVSVSAASTQTDDENVIKSTKVLSTTNNVEPVARKFLGAIPKSTNIYIQQPVSNEIPFVDNKPTQQISNFSNILSKGPKEFAITHFNSQMAPKKHEDSKELEGIFKNILTGYKIMVFMRGAPGSGKSHLAREIIDRTVKGDYKNFIFSSDDYFHDVNDRYVFKADKVPDSHTFNHKRVRQRAAAGWSPIIVDNTNIKIWEMSSYVRTAVQYGYIIEILQPRTAWSNSAGKMAFKNTHDVPKEVIQRMLHNFEPVTSKELLKINNERYMVKMPQFRHKPALPVEIVCEEAKMKVSRFDTNLQKTFSDKPTENSSYSTSVWPEYESTQKSEVDVQIDLPKPPRNTPRRQRNYVEKLDYPEDDSINTGLRSEEVDWKSYEEESGEFWHTKDNTIKTVDRKTPEEVKSQPQPQSQRNQFKLPEVENNIFSILREQVKSDSPKEDQQPESSSFVQKIKHSIGCPNENKSFVMMRQIYPNKQVDGLWDLFEKCNGDVGWAIDLLLKDDSCVDYQDPDRHESHRLQCLCEQECEVKSPDNENKDSGQIDAIKISRQKIKRDKTAVASNEMAEAKKAIEKQFVLRDDYYSSHIKKIRNIRYPELAESESNVLEVQTDEMDEKDKVLEDIEMDNKENDEDASSEMDHEMVEVDLGKDLIDQLHEIFEPDPTPQHTVNNFKTNVFMPKSLAKQLYAIWMESFYNQIEEQRQTTLKEDEEFARLLEKHQKYKKSNEPDTQCNFQDIMDMELALEIYKSQYEDWRDSTPQDLVSHLTRLKLYETFPNVDKETLLQVLTAHDNKFMDTVAVLKNSLNSKFDDKIQSKGIRLLEEVKNESEKELIEGGNRNSSESDDEKEELKNKLSPDEAKKAAIKDFEESRNLAVHHSQLKAECYQKAKEAIQKRNTAVAVYYSQIANLHKSKIDMYNHKAANCIMEVHDLTQNNPDFIDLHYLHVGEALECLDIFIDKHITKIKNLSQSYKYIFIITGRGLHSLGGVSTIKNRVKQRLKERNLKWSEVNPGLLKVKIFPTSKYSNNFYNNF